MTMKDLYARARSLITVEYIALDRSFDRQRSTKGQRCPKRFTAWCYSTSTGGDTRQSYYGPTYRLDQLARYIGTRERREMERTKGRTG
jgi:hypothetical protein